MTASGISEIVMITPSASPDFEVDCSTSVAMSVTISTTPDQYNGAYSLRSGAEARRQRWMRLTSVKATSSRPIRLTARPTTSTAVSKFDEMSRTLSGQSLHSKSRAGSTNRNITGTTSAVSKYVTATRRRSPSLCRRPVGADKSMWIAVAK
jgi:hypothetical protein